MSTTGDEVKRVDVVIPCYNDGIYLPEAVESLGVDRQDGSGVIIVNDGSTDSGTIKVLKDLERRGFRVINTTNNGLPTARNTGWQASSAPFILFLDADNKVDPTFPDRAAKMLGGDADLAVVVCDREEFGLRTGIVEQHIPSLEEELLGNHLDSCAVVRRDILERTGGYDEDLREGYEDWELWIRLMINGHRFHRIPEPLFQYRVRQDSLLGKANDPNIRHRIVDHIVQKHEAVYRAHAHKLVPELHRIQAHDQAAVRALKAELDALVGTHDHTTAELLSMGSAWALDSAQQTAEIEKLRELHTSTTVDLEKATARADEMFLRVADSEGRVETMAARLELIAKEKEILATEAHRTVGEVDKLQQALTVHRDHGRALAALIAQYEERINAIESSKLWRLRRGYNKMRALLRTSSGSSKSGFRWIRRMAFMVSQKGRRIMRRFLAKFFRAMYLLAEDQPVRILVGDEQLRATMVHSGDPYEQWMGRNYARPSDLLDQREQVPMFVEKPLISVVMPVYDPPIELLDAAIRSVIAQSYEKWELCIADDHSPSKAVKVHLEEWMAKEKRIRVVFREENGHISKASNSALELAQGKYVAFMDHDDLLAPDALFHVVKRLNKVPGTDIVYTDEDKVDEAGRHSEPHFKPQWCPDHLLSRNYFGHLVVMRTSLVRSVGGFREGFEGSQDYDLILRATEKAAHIERVPRVLYHWRIHAASAAKGEDVKPYAYQAARKALTEALDRKGEAADVSFLHGFRGYGIRFKQELRGKVSVIIPTKDKTEVLATCLHSLFHLTDHPDFEVVVVSNNSKEPAFFAFMKEMERLHPKQFRWFEHNVPFNFSGLMNFGIAKATGEQILFLNNDTEVIHADWMRVMHSWSQRPSIGAVGVKLLYHNDTIQHAGVAIGLGGVAGHTFVAQHKDGPGYFNYVNTVNNNSAVTAACMMVERSKLERIGGWEELFTVEYNDVDLCLRLREAGLNNVYVPDVSLYHFESLTRGHPHMTKESYERHLREVALFKERWAAYIADDPCYNPNLTRSAHDYRLAD